MTCKDYEKLIAERDEMEERVNRIAAALGLSEEEATWSNLNDPAQRCIEKVESLFKVGERADVETLIQQLSKLMLTHHRQDWLFYAPWKRMKMLQAAAKVLRP